MPDDLAYLPWVGLFLGLLCLIPSLRAARRKRLVDDIPTSKTTGVFVGLSEVKGSAEAESPLVSFLAGARCVLFAWGVEERWSRTVWARLASAPTPSPPKSPPTGRPPSSSSRCVQRNR